MVGVGGQRNRMPANPTGFNASANTMQGVNTSAPLDVNKVLNNYYSGGGEFYQGLFDDLGISNALPQEPLYQPQQQAPQQSQADPFMQFLMNQMGISGIGQQAPQQAPTNQYQQILATLRGADPLLSSLLGMLQLQPQPPPPVSNQRYGGF